MAENFVKTMKRDLHHAAPFYLHSPLRLAAADWRGQISLIWLKFPSSNRPPSAHPVILRTARMKSINFIRIIFYPEHLMITSTSV
ncbi:hypothetical protein SERMPA_00044 (plasmid) [Serratia marcescens]